MTSDTLDLRLAELLASRLCHDLVGPISAIGNGMELIDEGIAELDEEARRLVGDSAEQASAALQFFRVAFGFASAASDPAALRGLLEPFVRHRKTTLDWRAAAEPLPEGAGKLLLNMAGLAAEALPTGGRIEVESGSAGGFLELRCIAAGPGAALRQEVRAALADDARAEELTPRNVQGFYAARVAERLGARLDLEASGGDRVVLASRLPL